MLGKQSYWKYLVLLVPFALFVIMFELLPLFNIVQNSFKPVGGEGFTFANFKEIFASDYYTLSIRNSLIIAVISSLVGLAIAVLSAYAIHQSSSKIRNGFVNVLNMTANFQGIQLAFAFIILLGNSGILVRLGQQTGIDFLANYNLYSSSGIMLTFVYFQIPLATLLLYPSFDAIKTEYKEAAQLLHASIFQFWLRVGLPLLLPSILGTFAVMFSNALAAYATPYALMGTNFSLLPIRISSMFTGDVVQQVELGSALSLILLVLMGVTTILSTRLLAKLRKDL